MALLILCLGLFGLLGYTIRQRYQEISIRKVLGADTINVLVLLSRGYLKLMVIAILIAVPIANYVISDWLAGFAYRMRISIDIFLWPLISLAVIAGVIVVGLALHGNNKKIAEILRNE